MYIINDVEDIVINYENSDPNMEPTIYANVHKLVTGKSK